MKYSWKIGATKVVKYFVIFAIPALVDRFVVSYPELAQLTVGGLLVGIINWLKVKVGVVNI